MYGNNFVKTMIKNGENADKVYVINDQFGCPTYSKDLVDCTLNIIASNKFNKHKVYNFSNEGFTNWYEFTKKIFELKKITCDIIPVDSNNYKTTASATCNILGDGSGAKVLVKTDAAGKIESTTVTAGGSGYTYGVVDLGQLQPLDKTDNFA